MGDAYREQQDAADRPAKVFQAGEVAPAAPGRRYLGAPRLAVGAPPGASSPRRITAGMAEEVFLPGAAAAEIPEEKLRDYVLNPEHTLGRHKARVFAAALGIGRSDWPYLRDQIQERVAESPVSAIRPKPPHGIEYEIRMPIEGLNGETHSVITGWLAPEEGSPRLLTAYVEMRRVREA